MKVYLNEINGLWNAIVTMYMSKRSWTREREEYIKDLYAEHYDRWGKLVKEPNEEMQDLLDKLFKWAPRHITMGRFLDFSFTIEGMHRGAQDDLDSHAKRMENRILRSSTRLAKYGNEMSEWYQGKVIPTDEALGLLDIDLPTEIEKDGRKFVRTINGYVLSELKDHQDVKRGLYMLSIPSNCVLKINSTEFAHVVKERDINSNAHPELKICVEMMMEHIKHNLPMLTREYWYSVKN